MTYKKTIISFILIAIIVGGGYFWKNKQTKKKAKVKEVIIQPKIQDIRITVSTVGEVKPQNRIEVKPSISGRVESILVEEGDAIESGQVLALMSSTERAALLDAAKAKGPEEYERWATIYKPVQIVAPINGQIIVRNVEPGQTISNATSVVVLSDRLIVLAQVDETDIGKVKKNQGVIVSLDAYPDQKIRGQIAHISYESKQVNNVTIYEVQIVFAQIPDFFRSGMSATVDIIIAERKNALTLPVDVIKTKDQKKVVFIKQESGPAKPKSVKIGIQNDTIVEIQRGLKKTDQVVQKKSVYKYKKDKRKGNPLRPTRKRKK